MPTAAKVDLYKDYKKEYAATPKPAVVQMRPAVYLAISGQGAPGGAVFTDAMAALYGMAFTVKMTRKFAGNVDYVIGKLEALWPNLSCDNMPDKDHWAWQFLIRTPSFVTQKDLTQARETLLKRGKGKDAERVELLTLKEGLCVQALHVGPYEEAGKTIAAMQVFAEKEGLHFAGAHHEIYLSDPRRVDPAKLKTILREPVREV